MNKNITEAILHRRSVRVFDADKKIDKAVVKKCIKHATLAPTSSNMQLWEFHHITSKEMLQEMTLNCLDQSAAKTAQQMVVVVARKDLWKNRQRKNLTHLENLFGKKTASDYTPREKFALGYYQKIVPFIYTDFLGILGYFKYVMNWTIGFFKPSYRQVRKSDMRIVAQKSAGLAAQTFMLAMAEKGYDTCPMEGFDSLRVKRSLNLPLSAEINMVISCGIRKPEGIYGERFRIPFKDVYKQW